MRAVIAWFQGGPWEVLIVLFVILLLFGANRLPGLARSLGKSLSEFKKGKTEGEQKEAARDADESGTNDADSDGSKKF